MGVHEFKKGCGDYKGREWSPQMFSITEAEHKSGVVAVETREELGHAEFLCQA